MKRKRLRSGYTTGACAAAAAKAATVMLLSSESGAESCENIKDIEIPFPDGSRVAFKIRNPELLTVNSQLVARASVIKDAGDDPDVTNGAEIVAEVTLPNPPFAKGRQEEITNPQLIIKGGKGVGIVTKPGLAVGVGEPAINPVPRKMIKEAVTEAMTTQRAKGKEQGLKNSMPYAPCLMLMEITISVTDGEKLAKKTLNQRLGIAGGISILGTTGIVRPISSEAWTATITASMDVAKAMGRSAIVISAGRASEKAHMKRYGFPEEAHVMMGDYLEYSLLEAKKHGFTEIHLCAQWAKMLKIAMATPQTHVRHGAIDMEKSAGFLNSLGIKLPHGLKFNTAREIFEVIKTTPKLPDSSTPQLLFAKVCLRAKKYVEEITAGIPVSAHLVSYEGDIIAESG